MRGREGDREEIAWQNKIMCERESGTGQRQGTLSGEQVVTTIAGIPMRTTPHTNVGCDYVRL